MIAKNANAMNMAENKGNSNSNSNSDSKGPSSTHLIISLSKFFEVYAATSI